MTDPENHDNRELNRRAKPVGGVIVQSSDAVGAEWLGLEPAQPAEPPGAEASATGGSALGAPTPATRQTVSEHPGRMLRTRAPWRGNALAFLTVLSVAIGPALWGGGAHPADPPSPPVLDGTGIDPAVAKLVVTARAEVVRSPYSPAAWGRLGMAFDVHGFTDSAMRCFAEAERLDPHDAAWSYYQGLIQIPNNPGAAATKLHRSAELCGPFPEAPRLRLGLLLLAEGDLTRAEGHFQDVLRHDHDNARAHFGLARAASARGDWQTAREQVSHCLVDPTTRKAARMLLAQVLERLKDPAAAEAYRQAAGHDDQSWPDPFVLEASRLQTGLKTLLVRAGILLEQGHVTESIAIGKQAVKEYPDAAPAWVRLGEALLRQGDLVGSQTALSNAIRIEPLSIEAYFYLGSAANLREDYSEAAFWYRKAVEIKPDYARAYYALGACLARREELAAAIEALRQAIGCQPDLIEARTLLGEQLAKVGKTDEAVAQMRLALKLKPNDPKASRLLKQWVQANGSSQPVR
jgi:tetratricopeptide (TPR) repeat protein